MTATATETPLQTRLAACIQRLRIIEATKPALRREVGDLIDELSRIYRDIGGHEAPPESSQHPASRHNLVAGNRTRHVAKEHDGQRRCTRHNEGAGAWLPVAKFDVKNQATGALRSWCHDCTTAYQRERYVAVAAKTMTVELLEGDRCVGHDCPICGLPFEIGDRIRGENLHHEGVLGVTFADWVMSETRYVVHNVVAHPLLVLWPRAGDWLHDRTAPKVDNPGRRS